MNIQVLPTGELRENCYILSLPERDDAVVIDPGDDAAAVISLLAGRKTAAVLLTHGHHDHTGALHAFEGRPIYVHALDRELVLHRSFSHGEYALALKPRPEPTDHVSDGQIMKLAGITFQVLHTPGHTPGSVCYRVGESIFTGDTLFDGDYGRTDLPGGSMQQMRESLRRLFGLHGCHAYPGHGSDFIIQ